MFGKMFGKMFGDQPVSADHNNKQNKSLVENLFVEIKNLQHQDA